jgi:hypothetical protein
MRFGSRVGHETVLEVLMKTILVVSALSIALLVSVVPLVAHHAFSAEFDNSRPLNMRGVFVEMDWVNPHSWVKFEVTLPDGTVQLWMAETPPPNQLIRQGWRRNEIGVGDVIQVNGAAAKNGSPRMWASNVRILVQGGTTLEEPKVVLNMFSQNPEGVPEGLLPPTD